MDILADPGTYCYHGEREWRSYFRSTLAHNTVELGGQNSSTEGGPFLWVRHADARETEVIDDGDVARWTAEHTGYASLDPPATHRRSVLLDRASRSIDIIDEIEGGEYDVRLAFHFGPQVQVELYEAGALLRWETTTGRGKARLELPPGLHWTLHHGETDPIMGWYSSGLGRRVPAYGVIGQGRCVPGMPLATRLDFLEAGESSGAAVTRRLISWDAPNSGPGKAPEVQAEAR